MGGADSALVEACHHWQTVNTEGRIIMVCNNQNNTHNGKMLEVNTLEIFYLIHFCRLEGAHTTYL